MCVGVDKAWHHDALRLLQRVFRVELILEIRLRSHRNNAFAANRNCAVLNDAARRVHREHVSRFHQPIDRLPLRLSREVVAHIKVRVIAEGAERK